MTTTTAHPTLRELQAEIAEVNTLLGWYEDDRTPGEDLALLHSEVSEALEAYRDHGYADATIHPELCLECGSELRAPFHAPGGDHPFRPAKPEGVGSELADVVIRLLDTLGRWDTPEPYYLDLFLDDVIPYRMPMRTFGDKIAKAHWCIAVQDFELLLRLLVDLSLDAEVNLETEIVRKVAFNRTRGHRHGGKRL